MNEAYFRDKLSAYVDNELPPDERLIVEQYLAEHPEAQKILDEFRKLNAVVESEANLRDDLYWEKSARAIEQRLGIAQQETQTKTAEKQGWSPMRWTAVVATAASVAFIAYIGFRDRDQIEQNVNKQLSSPAVPAETTKSSVDSLAAKQSPESQNVETQSMKTSDSGATQRSPKLKTVDQRPVMATQQEAEKKKEAPAETASGGVEQPPAVAAPAPMLKSAERQTLNEAAHDEKDSEQPMKATAEFTEESSAADTLAQLRHQRDSLLALGTVKMPKSIVSGYTSSAKSITGTIKDMLPADRRLLLPIWYDIARLSPDSTERRQSIDSLRIYSTGKNELLRSAAVRYLDSLGIGNTDSAR